MPLEHLDYINDIKNVVSPESKINLGDIPYSDKQVMYLCADIEELEVDTGWRARVSFLEGINNIIAAE